VFISGLTNQQVSLLKDNFLNGILCWNHQLGWI
jgi:hypothetical protein